MTGSRLDDTARRIAGVDRYTWLGMKQSRVLGTQYRVQECLAAAARLQPPEEGALLVPPRTTAGFPFETTILDVLRNAEWTDRKRAHVLAAMLAEYTDDVKAETVQACADIARAWDPIEAALAGSAVAQDIANAITAQMLDASPRLDGIPFA